LDKKIEKTDSKLITTKTNINQKTFTGANGKGKVAHEPRRPTRPELIPLSVA